MSVVNRPLASVLGFRLEEGILSGWSMGGGGGDGGPLCGGSVVVVVGGGVCGGFKSRKAKRDARGVYVRPCSLVD